MNKTNKNSLPLSLQFAAWRKRQAAANLGAVAALCSLSTVRAVEKMEMESAASFTAEKVTERQTDDSTATGDEITLSPSLPALETFDTAPAGLGCLLSRAEREELETARPASVSVIFRRAPAPVAEISEPLPADFIPAPVVDFSPAVDVSFSADEQAEIDAEVCAELAEIDRAEKAAAALAFANAFRSDWRPKFAPVDYAPLAVHYERDEPAKAVPAPAPVAVVTVAAPAPAAMDFDALRAAILARPVSNRRKTAL